MLIPKPNVDVEKNKAFIHLLIALVQCVSCSVDFWYDQKLTSKLTDPRMAVTTDDTRPTLMHPI